MNWQDHIDLIKHHRTNGDAEQISRANAKLNLLEEYSLKVGKTLASIIPSEHLHTVMTAMRNLVMEAHGDKPSLNPNIRYELYRRNMMDNSWNMVSISPSYMDDRIYTKLDRDMFMLLEDKLNLSSDPDDRYIILGDSMWAISISEHN